MTINEQLAQELSLKLWQVEQAVKLLDEGNTVPFIARYRKEVTGELNDEVLRELEERLVYLRSMEERGFLVSMDDFGTGYSTMNMLKNQTLDEIKIDREFIRDLEKDKSQIIIRNTIAMLQQLGAHIVIEGVETEEQKEFLLGCNCTDVQGFLFYRPMPVEEFDKLLWQQERELDMAK